MAKVPYFGFLHWFTIRNLAFKLDDCYASYKMFRLTKQTMLVSQMFCFILIEPIQDTLLLS